MLWSPAASIRLRRRRTRSSLWISQGVNVIGFTHMIVCDVRPSSNRWLEQSRDERPTRPVEGDSPGHVETHRTIITCHPRTRLTCPHGGRRTRSLEQQQQQRHADSRLLRTTRRLRRHSDLERLNTCCPCRPQADTATRCPHLGSPPSQ